MKKIIKAIIVGLVVWLISMAIHIKFLNLEYEILRSTILGVGAVAMYYVISRRKSSSIIK